MARSLGIHELSGFGEEQIEHRKLEMRDRVVENFKNRLEGLSGDPLKSLNRETFARVLLKNLRFFSPRNQFEIRVFDIDEVLRESNVDSQMTATELHSLQNQLYLALKECGVVIQDRYQKSKLD